MKQKKSTRMSGGTVFAFVVVLLIFLLGTYMSFVVFPSQLAEMRQVSLVPLVNKQQLSLMTAGQDVMVSGRLQDNPAINDNGFVAYTHERWDVRYNNGDYEGRWWGVKAEWPSLLVAIEGGLAQTVAGEPSNHSGTAHERIEPRGGNKAARYDGKMLPHGSLRILGVKNGDEVTLVGTTSNDATIKPSHFYMGDRQALLDSLAFNSQAIRIIGFVLMGLAIIIGLIVLFKQRTTRTD
jgi:hypothetical protein